MKKLGSIVFLSLCLFIIDRLTKSFILKLPQKFTEGVFLNDNIDLKTYLNPGIAFGLPLPNILSILLVIIILTGLIYFLRRAIKQRRLYLYLPLSLIIIGSASNLIDRLRFGAVVDFISFYFWPAFNLADCYIVGGILLFLLNYKRYFSTEPSKTVTGKDAAKHDFSK
jgi:signal peptidase II